MKFFKNLLSAVTTAALLLASSPFALAQVPSGQPVYNVQSQTYRATTINLAPAASATDFFTIQGSASRAIQVRKIICAGVSTANASALIQVVKRSTLDTTGTSTSPTAVPLNPGTVAAVGVVKAYTVNPGVLGTSLGVIDAGFLVTSTLASATVTNDELMFDFTNQNVFLVGATAQLALNANGQSFTAGASLSCTVEWSEQ